MFSCFVSGCRNERGEICVPATYTLRAGTEGSSDQKGAVSLENRNCSNLDWRGMGRETGKIGIVEREKREGRWGDEVPFLAGSSPRCIWSDRSPVISRPSATGGCWARAF